MAQAPAALRKPQSGAEAPHQPACPGCGSGVDPLRAGHVAVFDGVFLYYCGQPCKAAHLREVASSLGDDVATMDPPAVAERFAASVRGAANVAASTVPPASHERERGSAPSVGAQADAEARAEAEAEADAKAEADAEAEAHAEAEADADPDDFADSPSPALSARVASTREPELAFPAPTTMRSPAPSLPEAPSAPLASEGDGAAEVDEPSLPPVKASLREQARGAATVVACAAGAFVPMSSVADAGIAARIGLAAVATVAVSARVALGKRDAADVHPAIAVAPVVVALAAAIVAHATEDVHAAAIVALAGLGAAVVALVEAGIERARREVDAARAEIVRALGVPVRVVRPGAGGEVVATDARAGEAVVLDAGETAGVDGVVTAGDAVVVPWHGAPIDVTKGEGDAVVAGARVVTGRLRVTTSWAGAERAWLRAATSSAARADVSAPIARVARQVMERFTPVAAVVAGLAGAYVGGVSGVEAVAIACAAGLALGSRGVVAAVALAHARAQGKGLAHGVVYKDAKAFDAAGRAAIAVVCSRGTVLTGEPEIVALEAIGSGASGGSESHILALAAGAESASSHPYAAAILRAARTRGVAPESVRSTMVHEGLGVTALIGAGDRLVVGSRALLLQEKVSVAVADTRASELEAQGRSVLLVAVAGKLVGLVALQDGLRAGARAAVQRLLDARIEPVLLSGESRDTSETIARALDIDHVRPEVLPGERGAEVRALGEGGHVVAVIGHAASDDGALGAADVAVAMSAAGRAAGEWAVSLASDDVRDAALALALPHGARERARAALAMGLAPGVIALLAVASGVAPIVLGPLAMALGVALAMTAARRPD